MRPLWPVDQYIVVVRLDALHFADRYGHNGVRLADEEAIQRCGPRSREQSVGTVQCVDIATGVGLSRAFQGSDETLVTEGLEQIVQGLQLERGHGVLIECSGEDHDRRLQ